MKCFNKECGEYSESETFNCYQNAGMDECPKHKDEAEVMEIEQKVINHIADYLEIDSTKVTPESSLVNDLGADSLDLVELVMGMEEEFDVEISDEAAEKIVTVREVIENVQSLLNN